MSPTKLATPISWCCCTVSGSSILMQYIIDCLPHCHICLLEIIAVSTNFRAPRGVDDCPVAHPRTLLLPAVLSLRTANQSACLTFRHTTWWEELAGVPLWAVVSIFVCFLLVHGMLMLSLHTHLLLGAYRRSVILPYTQTSGIAVLLYSSTTMSVQSKYA